MKSISFFITLIFTLFIHTFTICLAGDFREADWGMTKEQVEKLENSKKKSLSIDKILYLGELGNLEVMIGYHFINNKLVKGQYIFDNKHTDSNQYILDYNKINDLLCSKYGDYASDRTVWNNDLFKNRPNDYGMALSVGHLVYMAVWYTDKSKIFHAIGGDNHEISHGITYEDINSIQLNQAEQKKKSLKGI